MVLKYLYQLVFIGILFLAFCIRYPHLYIQRLWPDEALYSWYAHKIFLDPSIIFSKEIIEFHPPLFACLLAPGHLFFSKEIACHLIPFLTNLSGIYLIYRLGIKIKDQFTGLLAAINLAFNFLYISSSTQILLDGTLTVFIMLFAGVLLNTYSVPKNSSSKKQITLGFIGALILLLKWSGLLIIPLLLVCVGFFLPHLSPLDRWKKASIPFLILSVTLLFLLVNNLIQLGYVLPDTSALEGKYLIKPPWYYLFNLHNIRIIPYLLPFFIFGLWVIFKKRNPGHLLLMAWFFVFLTGISCTPEKDLRYSLTLLPSLILISSIGLSTFIDHCSKTQRQKVFIEILMILILLGSYGVLYPRTQKFLDRSSVTFIGFKEAGQWIKQETKPDTVIMASSPRLIRYYSNIDFQEFGGQIIPLPINRLVFEEISKHALGSLIVEVDSWEKTCQPSWLYPVSDKTQQYMKGLGFQLVQVIKKNIYGLEGMKEMRPVIWIFKKYYAL